MPAPDRRRLAAALLALGVVAAHLVAARWLLAALRPASGAERWQRFEVAFVRELRPAPGPPKAVVRRANRVAVAAAAPASAAVPAPTEIAPGVPLPAPPAPRSTPEAATDLATEVLPVAGEASSPAQTQAAGFAWPPSTRMSYSLTGNYRGPVEGSAEVEWLRDGMRYQVHLDVVIGLRLAPLMTRTLSSEGRLGEHGLEPARYEERSRLLFREAWGASIRFGAQQIEWAGGRRGARPTEVQDAVSQFVQLTWRLRTEPSLLTPGQVVVLMLALPGGVSPWIYDVGPEETLLMPFGPVSALPLRPRRTPRRGGDLVATTWFAANLQYLPVRILIHQDEQTYLDLRLERLPLQEAPPWAPASSDPGAGAQPAPKRSP